MCWTVTSDEDVCSKAGKLRMLPHTDLRARCGHRQGSCRCPVVSTRGRAGLQGPSRGPAGLGRG